MERKGSAQGRLASLELNHDYWQQPATEKTYSKYYRWQSFRKTLITHLPPKKKNIPHFHTHTLNFDMQTQ
jgi:hypothetical protein